MLTIWPVFRHVGHGFGLAHTDENFNNANLGNCLDYTNNFTPEQIQPGLVNYERLESKYGVVTRRRLVAADYDSGKNAVPDWIHEEYERKHARLLVSGNRDEIIANGWVLLHESPMGAEFALGLGEGFHVRATMLLAN